MRTVKVSGGRREGKTTLAVELFRRSPKTVLRCRLPISYLAREYKLTPEEQHRVWPGNIDEDPVTSHMRFRDWMRGLDPDTIVIEDLD